MKKTMWVIPLAALLAVIGCGKQPEPSSAVSDSEVQAVAPQDIPGVSSAVSQEHLIVSQAAQAVAQKAQVLLAQAKQYLDQGKLNEAINLAQNVLQFDPNNLDAKQIIEMAKAKLKALAGQKTGELKSGLMNKLGTMGQ